MVKMEKMEQEPSFLKNEKGARGGLWSAVDGAVLTAASSREGAANVRGTFQGLLRVAHLPRLFPREKESSRGGEVERVVTGVCRC